MSETESVRWLSEERKKPRILAIDDDEDILAYIESLLSRDYDIITTGSHVDIEGLISELRPSMLLLDYRMPNRNGLDICQSLRKNPEFDTMPIVFLSGVDSEDLRLRGYSVGADDFIPKPFDAAELRAKIEVWSRMGERQAELVSKNRRLKELTLKDDLTGLVSRRHVLELLETEIARYHRYNTPVAVLLIDIDDFKLINDTYGHAAGDEALKTVAHYLRSTLRENDIVARYGGDEFLIILPNSDIEAARSVCEKIENTSLLCRLRPHVEDRLSLSIGAASISDRMKTATQLIDTADLAMFTAKRSGKGRYHVAEPDRICPPILKDVQVSRHSMRDLVCQLLSLFLREFEREGDVIGGRIDRMRRLAMIMADRLGLTLTQRTTLRNAIQIFHCEKIGLPHEIATAPGKLPPEQMEVVHKTIQRNLDHLRRTGLLDEEAEVLAASHEWWNGQGFPQGLAGEAIPLLGRILGLLSAYCLFREGKAHTPMRDNAEGWRLIRSEAGRRFDPNLVALLEAILRESGEFADEDKKTGSILIVDDNFNFCKVLSKRLEWVGYRTSFALNGEEARQRCREGGWDLLLLDIMMPDIDGLTLLGEIRNIPEMQKTPILMTSCRNDTQAILRAQQEGAAGYVVKPIAIEKLLHLIEVVLAEKNTRPVFHLLTA